VSSLLFQLVVLRRNTRSKWPIILTHIGTGPKAPNPLHADPEPGKKMGFGGPIIHGLFSWNMSAHAILQTFGSSKPENMKEFQARFAAPVKPADKLITEMWRTGEKGADGFEEIRFVVRVEGGKTVLTNGRAMVKVEGQIKAKL
jgi:acyl dehydratase